MKLLQSTTFWFSVVILFVAGLAAWFDSEYSWAEWVDAGISLVMFYAGKESIRYGAEAYKEKK